MTEPTPAAQPLSLISRIIGVITSPRATFANVVAVPRPVGAMLIVAIVLGLAQTAPRFTEAGRKAALDAQVKVLEQFGGPVTPEAYGKMEERGRSPLTYILTFAGTFLFLPVVALFFAVLYWAVFNIVMGGTATYKQVLAIVTHSQVIPTIGVALAVPIQLAKGAFTVTGPFTLGALAPMAEPGSTLAAFLSSIDVFRLWGIGATSIGLAVLYRRSSPPIGIALLAIYLLFALAFATLFGKFITS